MMIASKLILYFCFYLLLLENSLGKKQPVLEKRKNKKLLGEAFRYGDDYGGDLRVLGLKWKNLLQEIVFAKRKVGFHEDQLERLFDAAGELGHAQKDVDFYKLLYRKAPVTQFKQKLDAVKEIYANKFAALIAVRTQDIAKDQKRINDLETEKDEIAIAMIDKMEEINEKFKRKNVRRKVKEAKDDGITDSDIKEILFADFFQSGGFSLIGGGASIAGPLLSSFREGLESLVDEDYDSKLGVIQFVNGVPVGENDHPLAGGDDDSIEYVVPGSSGGGSGGAAGGGGSGGSGGSGGPPTSPPSGPPSGAELPDDSHEQEGDEDKDKEDTKLHKCLATTLRMDDEETSTTKPIPLKKFTWVTAHYNTSEQEYGQNIVRPTLRPLRMEIETLEQDYDLLNSEYGYAIDIDPSLNPPRDRDLNYTEKLDLANRRLNFYQGLLNRIQAIRERHDELRERLFVKYNLTKLNQRYFQALFSTNSSVVVPPVPLRIVEINNIPENDRDVARVQALVVAITWREMDYNAYLFNSLNTSICTLTDYIETQIEFANDYIRSINARRFFRE